MPVELFRLWANAVPRVFCGHGKLALHERDEAIPEVISAIVAKLLAKPAEERYQSAYGLEVDLDECRERLRQTGSIASFSLGTKDAPLGLRAVQKLHGRDKERAALVSAFQRAADGAAELVLVKGHLVETALQGASNSGAEVLILDITGVEQVDRGVSETLVDIANAVKLLGAETVITGMRPDVAQQLVALNIDLTSLVTRGTLQTGITYAMQRRRGRAPKSSLF